MPRLLRVAGPAALVIVAFLSLLAALAIGGGAAPQLLEDAGPVVRYGLPAAKMMVNLSAATAIGALLLAAFALSRQRPEYGRALDIAAAGAALWTVASAITAFFTFLSVSGTPFSFSSEFGTSLGLVLTQISVGQAWLATTLIAATVTVLCFAVRNHTAIAFVLVIAVGGLVPMAQQGHAGGTEGHDAAVNALGLHLVFAAVWLGGLLTMVLLRSKLDGDRLVPVLRRYSAVALVCFVVVAASGYVSAEIRVGTLDRLLTAYGLLVLIKVASLLALGLFGAAYRRVLIGRLEERGSTARGPFWWLVTAELAFMGVASGVAAALARTAPPVSQVVATQLPDPTPAQILTGEPLPPELTPMRYLTEWNFDLLWILLCAFGIFFYLAGVHRLRKRGDAWPVHRSILWVAGMIGLFYITNGGVNVYQKYLFSSHMLAHMVLAMVIPLLLVPGAPVTLAMRAIRKRQDGSRGGREWILMAVHSRFASFVGHPIVAAVLFAGSLLVFYYSPLFSWATTDHIGHQWMIVHFLIVGYLFTQNLIGVDPMKVRIAYPMRLLLLLATMAFHAFFGLSLMTGTGLLLADWFGAMGRPWGESALADQQAGGGIAWSIGEIPTVVLAIVTAIMWSKSDKRDSVRYDRKADRDGDAELEAYNRNLEALQASERR
ncbi:Inner membrane protein YebZ [Clavibacter michiganensis]|uniref:Inner membrane protein YebZ n=1 Tax=Clavibacter michiganensis TaxID=28447 RepID=A0A251Y6V7_9MICO|nr:cytochrome c oxidase assembly protein [Clavibacter michiganensis]OUE19753.1 Inner membrane protein YebZ [Clavibacter michiganensis]